MTNQNFKPIQKPVAEVKELENTWEQQLQTQEQEVQHEIERTDEEKVYIAEAVETENSQNHLAHQPSFQPERRVVTDPQTNKPAFFFRINLEQCYLTHDNFWTTFLWRDSNNYVKKIIFEKIEEAEDLLHQLKAEKVRLVDDLWGFESQTITKTKNRLKEKLQNSIQKHHNGEAIVTSFNDFEEWLS